MNPVVKIAALLELWFFFWLASQAAFESEPANELATRLLKRYKDKYHSANEQS